MTVAPSTPSMFGTYKGIVTNNNDLEGMGRVKAICPTVFGDMTTETEWAWPCVMPGAVFTTPQPGEGVWLQFEAGDTAYPVWLGTWNTGGKGQVIPVIPPIPGPATTVVGPDTFGESSAVGSSKLYARADHDHGLPLLLQPFFTGLARVALPFERTVCSAAVPVTLPTSPPVGTMQVIENQAWSGVAANVVTIQCGGTNTITFTTLSVTSFTIPQGSIYELIYAGGGFWIVTNISYVTKPYMRAYSTAANVMPNYVNLNTVVSANYGIVLGTPASGLGAMIAPVPGRYTIGGAISCYGNGEPWYCQWCVNGVGGNYSYVQSPNNGGNISQGPLKSDTLILNAGDGVTVYCDGNGVGLTIMNVSYWWVFMQYEGPA